MRKRWVCLLTLLVLLMCPLARADFGEFSDGALSSGYSASFAIGAGGPGITFFASLLFYVLYALIVSIFCFICHLIGRFIGRFIRRVFDLEPSDTAPSKSVSYLQPVSELHDFDEAKLLQQIPAIYMMLQNAWTAGDLTPIQPLLTIPYYAQVRDNLQKKYLNTRIKNHFEQIKVTDVKMIGCMPGHYGETDQLFVSIDASFINYLTNIFGSVTQGSKTDRIYMHYEWEMERRRNNPNAFTASGSTLPDDVRCDWIITRITGYPRT